MAACPQSMLQAIRQNHALEHATVHVLSRLHPERALAGRSGANGFWLVGDLDTQEVADAVSEALGRLQNGERTLAVHPRCGSNIATAGVLAGIAALIAVGRHPRRRLDLLPQTILATTVAILLAQPLGKVVQERFTTDPDVQDVRITAVLRQQLGSLVAHQIVLERG